MSGAKPDATSGGQAGGKDAELEDSPADAELEADADPPDASAGGSSGSGGAGGSSGSGGSGGSGGTGGAPGGGAGGLPPPLGDDCGKLLEIDQLVASPPHWASAQVPVAGLTQTYTPSNPKPGSSACWSSSWPDLIAHYKANGSPSFCANRSVSCSLSAPWASAMSVAKFKCPPSLAAYTSCCPGVGPCSQQVVSVCGGEDIFVALWLAPGAPPGATVQCFVY